MVNRHFEERVIRARPNRAHTYQSESGVARQQTLLPFFDSAGSYKDVSSVHVTTTLADIEAGAMTTQPLAEISRHWVFTPHYGTV
jgi:hypothetical protein